MRYEKPEVVVLSDAVKAIQSVFQKQPSLLTDHINGSVRNTGPAYEADE